MHSVVNQDQSRSCQMTTQTEEVFRLKVWKTLNAFITWFWLPRVVKMNHISMQGCPSYQLPIAHMLCQTNLSTNLWSHAHFLFFLCAWPPALLTEKFCYTTFRFCISAMEDYICPNNSHSSTIVVFDAQVHEHGGNHGPTFPNMYRA